MNNSIRQTLALLLLMPTYLVQANPTGAQIVNGQVSIDSSTPGVLNITNSPNAIINWQDFSIGQNEITQFIQENGQSAVLNQIIGQNPSEILGQLVSNGHVFLINPNGIIFGANSMVNTQGLIASTLNLSNEDFLRGNYHFAATDSAGDIVNQGIIRAGADGNIVLIAPDIENNGIIQTDGGSITLAAGEELTLTNLDEPEIQFQIQAPENQVLNLGKVLTNGGAIDLFAGNITHSGELNANSVEMDAQGNIRLVAIADINLTETSITTANNTVDDAGSIQIKSEQGTTLVSGQVSAESDQGSGGHIEILGDQVGLIEQAQIIADGTNGGGEILVGGDYKGQNTDVKNATASYVGEQVLVSADATEQGDGGKVIIWSDEVTRVHGSISATGGAESGNGGFIETSGHYLEVTSTPDASATNGQGGTWLLDPYNIEITGGVTTHVSETKDPSDNTFFETTDHTLPETSKLDISLINTALEFGDVTIDTHADGGTEAGNVVFGINTDIIKLVNPDTSTLTINADGMIDLSDSSISTLSSALNIILTADRDGNGGGGIIIGEDEQINSGGGDISLTTLSGNIELLAGPTNEFFTDAKAAEIISDGGAISLTANAGNLILNYHINETGVGAPVFAGATIDSSSGGAPSGDIAIIAQDLIMEGTSQIIATGSNVTLAPTSTTEDIFIGTAGAGFSLTATELSNITANILTIGRITDTGTLTVNAPLTSALNANTLSLKHENIVIDAPIDFSTDNETLILTAATLVDINNAITTGSGLLSITAPTVNLNPAGGTININGIYAATTTNLDGAGTIDFLDNYTLDTVNHSNGNLTTSNGDTVTISNSYNWFAGAGEVSGTLDIEPAAALNFKAGAVAGDWSLWGAINNSGTATVESADTLVFFAGSTFNNLAGANLNFEASPAASASGIINNFGTITKSDPGDLLVNIQFNNLSTGVVNVQNGRVRLNNPNNTYNGVWNITEGANELNFPLGTSLAMRIDGPTNIDGVFNVASGTTVSFATSFFGTGSALFTSNASITGAGNVSFTRGTYTFDTDSVYDISGFTDLHNNSSNPFSLTFNNTASTGGLLLREPISINKGDVGIFGTGTLTANGLVDLELGTIGIALTANGDTIINGDVVLDGVFNNNGSLAWNSGDVSGLGSFNNNAGATFTVNSDNLFESESSFTNLGTLTKAGGAGTTTFALPFINSGTVNANSGVINFGGYTQTAGITDLGGGDIIDSSGTSNFNGGILQGEGTYTVGTLNINPGATISPGNSPGFLNVVGNLVLNGITLIEIEGLGQGTEYDFINVTGDVFLGGSLVVDTTAYAGQAFGDAFDVIQATGPIIGSFANTTFNGGTNYISQITETPTFRLISLFPPIVTEDPAFKASNDYLIGFPPKSGLGDIDDEPPIGSGDNTLKQCI